MPIQKVAVHPVITMMQKETTDSKETAEERDEDNNLTKETVIGIDTEVAGDSDATSDRCDSQMSAISDRSDICRICHCEGDEDNKLFSPCLCLGSLKYVHLHCLQKWIRSSDKNSCELCHFDYIMTAKTKPFSKWERLDLSTTEKRKIACSVTFHVIAITCVIWSMYVLLERTTEEASSGKLDWPFWTKLIVVAIGFTGGVIFMYVQCKMYFQLVKRWRAFNKVISIQSVPETEEFRINAMAKIKSKEEESGGVTNEVALQEVESL